MPPPPPPDLPLTPGSPLETTTLTREPGATLVPAAGLSLSTEPGATELFDYCVTVPSTSPAPLIALAACA
jgi:hypothetical protein